MFYIENDRLKAGFEAHGAELRSLVDKTTGEEYMWCGDPAFWGRVSPVLFPVVGNYKNKTSIYDGKEYHLSQHGFARDSEFEVVEQKDDSISFKLASSDKTKEVYPFDFELIISYELKASDSDLVVLSYGNNSGDAENASDLQDSLIVKWEVRNTDDKTIYFSIGGHPAFNLRDEDSYIHFERIVNSTSGFAAGGEETAGNDNSENKDDSDVFITAGILEDGLLSDRTKQIKLTSDELLKPTVELFAEDALILEKLPYNAVALSGASGKDYLRVKYDAPVLGIWSPAGKNAPFVCIEPWFGRTDRTGFNMNLEEREYGNSLQPGENFIAEYTVTV